MKLLKVVLLLTASMFVSSVFAQEAVPAVAVASNEISAAIGKPEPGKALIVFFRPSAFKGGAINFIVREGEAELGRLRSGNYFTLQVEPGKHTYTVHAENQDVNAIEAEEGETYFFAGEINFGFLSGRPNLAPSNQEGFAAAFKKLKKSKPL